MPTNEKPKRGPDPERLVVTGDPEEHSKKLLHVEPRKSWTFDKLAEHLYSEIPHVRLTPLDFKRGIRVRAEDDEGAVIPDKEWGLIMLERLNRVANPSELETLVDDIRAWVNTTRSEG